MKICHTRTSFWRGIALAPLAAPLTFLAYTFLSIALSPGLDFRHGRGLATVILVTSVPASYAAMFLAGLPYLLWLQKAGRMTWLSVCSAGAVAGGAAALAAAAVLDGGLFNPDIELVLLGAGCGLSVGVAFLLVTGPNNSSKPTPLRGAAYLRC